jgi:hypothetical protein
MPKIVKTKTELEDLIRVEVVAIGRWPKNMSVLVYPLGETWGAMFGFSDVSQTEYRDQALAMCVRLRETYNLAE